MMGRNERRTHFNELITVIKYWPTVVSLLIHDKRYILHDNNKFALECKMFCVGIVYELSSYLRIVNRDKSKAF